LTLKCFVNDFRFNKKERNQFAVMIQCNYKWISLFSRYISRWDVDCSHLTNLHSFIIEITSTMA